MKQTRLFSLAAGMLVLGMAGISAQVPKVGQPVQIKPGDPGKQPQIKAPDPVKAVNPPAKGVNPPVVPPMNPLVLPPVPPRDPNSVVPPLGPGKKELDDFPKEIGEKTLNMWMAELKTSKDAAVRENAIRTFPMFGPRAMVTTSELLLTTLKTDPDMNVKLTALSMAPYQSYNQQEDPFCNDRLDAVIRLLDAESLPIRFEAINIITGIGPVAKKAIPRLVANSYLSSSWQIRRAATAALGSIGRGWINPDNPAEKIDPTEAAVTGLLERLKTDTSLTVKREAANSLIMVGPVSSNQYKVWKMSLDGVLKTEKDRGVLGLVRVAILKNDPAGVKGNEPLLAAITAQLLAPDAAARSEACQALGMIGEPANKKAQDLLDVITNPKEENSVTAAAIVAVANMKTQAGLTVPVLRKVAATHKNEDVKAYATEAVKILQGEENKGALPGVAVPPAVPEKK